MSKPAATPLRFDLEARSGAARAGRITTPHGAVETPAFLPVGTHGAVKAMTPDQVRACGAQMVLANTYHLALRPGEKLVEKLGGLHEFMRWPGPILTDSGGFQAFSLPGAEIGEGGVHFKNEVTGEGMELTPERAIEIQNALGADIIMAFDECTPFPAERERAGAGVRRTPVRASASSAGWGVHSSKAMMMSAPSAFWISTDFSGVSSTLEPSISFLKRTPPSLISRFGSEKT